MKKLIIKNTHKKVNVEKNISLEKVSHSVVYERHNKTMQQKTIQPMLNIVNGQYLKCPFSEDTQTIRKDPMIFFNSANLKIFRFNL